MTIINQLYTKIDDKKLYKISKSQLKSKYNSVNNFVIEFRLDLLDS